MNLLRFTWETARALYFVPAVFIYGSIATLGDTHDYKAAGLVLMSGAFLCAVILLKMGQHRRTLDLRNAQAYVRNIIHNAPQGLPEEQAGVEYVRYLFDNPIR